MEIVPARALPSDASPSPEPEERRAPLTVTSAPRHAEGSPKETEEKGRNRFPASDPASQRIEFDPAFPAFDSRYYLAQELDSYPRPLAPLHLGGPAGGGAAEVLLEILVDERGVVQDVILGPPSQSGRANEELRAVLAATHFMPARKDGRAVRSRLTLRVKIDRVDGER